MEEFNLTRRGFLICSSIITVAPTLLSIPTVSFANKLELSLGDEHILTNSIRFNGERLDPISGMYHLGHGYRVFDPKRMIFNQLDIVSPFNHGGLNPYLYCNGNPLNYIDPTGYSPNAIGMVSNAIGFAFNAFIMALILISAPFTGGASLLGMVSAGFGLASSGIGAVSGVIGFAGSAIDDENPAKSGLSDAASILGITAGVLAVPALGTGAGSAVNAMKANQLAKQPPFSLRSKIPISLGKTNGKSQIARRVTGTTFEAANSMAGITGFVGQKTGNQSMVDISNWVKVGVNLLPFPAYAPLNYSRYTRGQRSVFDDFDEIPIKSRVSVLSLKCSKEIARTTNSFIHFLNAAIL